MTAAVLAPPADLSCLWASSSRRFESELSFGAGTSEREAVGLSLGALSSVSPRREGCGVVSLASVRSTGLSGTGLGGTLPVLGSVVGLACLARG